MKLIGGAVRISLLVCAVYLGICLGLRPHRFHSASLLSSTGNGISRTPKPTCSEIKKGEDFVTPLGYSTIGIRRIGKDYYALVKADTQPAAKSGFGFADVYGSDGRLDLRFFAIGRSDGKWDFLEYRRISRGESPLAPTNKRQSH